MGQTRLHLCVRLLLSECARLMCPVADGRQQLGYHADRQGQVEVHGPRCPVDSHHRPGCGREVALSNDATGSQPTRQGPARIANAVHIEIQEPHFPEPLHNVEQGDVATPSGPSDQSSLPPGEVFHRLRAVSCDPFLVVFQPSWIPGPLVSFVIPPRGRIKFRHPQHVTATVCSHPRSARTQDPPCALVGPGA